MPSFLSLNVNYDNRIFGLDLMRAIAIINVVIVHAGWMDMFPGYPWVPLIPGVELFFVLSGFLIGSILLKTYLKEEQFGFQQIALFWKRRWFRTLPNYYLILLLNIVFVYFGIIHEDFGQFDWTFFVFSQNLYNEFYGFFWESWSLSIEEWFYLSFPVILFLMHLFLRKTGVGKKHVYLINILLFLSFSLLMRNFIGSNLSIGNSFGYDVKIHKVVIYHLDGIAFGVLASYLKHCFPRAWFKSRNVTFAMGLVLCFSMRYFNWFPEAHSTIVFKTMMQSLGCFLLLPRFETIKKAPKVLRNPITHISMISYSMYLTNLSIISSVITSNFQIQSKTAALIWYVVYWVAVVVLSTLIYKFYEKPMMDLRDRRWVR